MATWRDGPEYAPVERPTAFAGPASAVSLEPPPPTPKPPEPPVVPPQGFRLSANPGPPLDRILPAPPAQRDATKPFDVVAPTLTASAWGSAHTNVPAAAVQQPPVMRPRVADQPFQPSYPPPSAAVANFPAPGTPQWFGPSTYQAPPRAPVQITVRSVVEAAYPPLLICLALGGLIPAPPFSEIFLIVAIILTWAPGRVAYRRVLVRNLAIGAFVIVCILELVFIALNSSIINYNLHVTPYAMAGCWILLAADLLIQFAAMRAGEQPEKRPPQSYPY